MTCFDTVLLGDAIDHWGEDKQTDQLIEEMSELIQAIIHCRRSGGPYKSSNLIEELADVSICLEQLKIIAGRNFVEGYFDELLQDVVDSKSRRLQSRLDMSKAPREAVQ